ncbi:hypothetical protein [Micromonospora fluostatini]|uniref:hypothetical protein n=1 Tax=Micromonospora sp. JCM 30529 TaxID=3421643 RepID=UPI003D18766A
MNAAAQTGYVPPPGPPEPPPARPWPRWLIAATVAWAVLLAALTWISAGRDEPTVREQRTLAEAAPVVDRAVGAVLGAAGTEPVVLLGPDRLDPGCRVTPFVEGATLVRAVEIVAPADQARPLLERIAAGLPAEYQARVRVSDRGARLSADAGEFVTVTGEFVDAGGEPVTAADGPDAPGRVRVSADTGCRPLGGYEQLAAPPAGPEVDALSRALAALGRPASTPPELLMNTCPGSDRRARTARVSTDPPADPAAARPASAGALLLDTPDGYAYRSGPVTVLVDHSDTRLHLAATTPCPAP